jgi:hypothetical protein
MGRRLHICLNVVEKKCLDARQSDDDDFAIECDFIKACTLMENMLNIQTQQMSRTCLSCPT